MPFRAATEFTANRENGSPKPVRNPRENRNGDDSYTQDSTEEADGATKCQCQAHCGDFTKGHTACYTPSSVPDSASLDGREVKKFRDCAR